MKLPQHRGGSCFCFTIFICVFYMFVTAFSTRAICFLFAFLFLRLPWVRNIINPPPLAPGESPAVFTHWIHLNVYRLRRPAGETMEELGVQCLKAAQEWWCDVEGLILVSSNLYHQHSEIHEHKAQSEDAASLWQRYISLYCCAFLKFNKRTMTELLKMSHQPGKPPVYLPLGVLSAGF